VTVGPVVRVRFRRVCDSAVMPRSQSAVVRARSVLIEVAAGGGTITRQALARRLQLRYDFRSSNDRHMMVSLLGAVAELEYSYGRPFLSVVVAEGRREGDLFYWGLLGYAEALKFPDRSTVRKFVAAERKRAHEHWSGRVRPQVRGPGQFSQQC